MVYQTDVKRPDKVSIVPWKGDKILVWDVTCPGTWHLPTHLWLHEKLVLQPKRKNTRRLRSIPTFLQHISCPNRCGVDGCVWPRRMKQLSRISPMYKVSCLLLGSLELLRLQQSRRDLTGIDTGIL